MSTRRKKILVVRFSSIGDIVLTSPVVRCLKDQLNAEVHFLTKTIYVSIVKPNPNIDKIFHIKKKIGEVLPALKKENYDHVIDLHKNLRSLQVKFFLGKNSSSFDKLNYEKWLLTNLKLNKLPDIHIVDRYLQTIAFLEVRNDGKGLDYFIPTEDRVDPKNILQDSSSFVVFAIGAAHATKRLPAKKIEEICRGIDHPVILIGGPSDKEEGEEVAQQAGSHVYNQCGKLNLHQSASLIEQSILVLTHDTGMMHIAAAFKKQILSIWGNTVPEFGMYPYYPEGLNKNQSFEVNDLNCRPCSKIGYNQCPKTHFDCMQKQDVAAIVKRAGELLS